jgi:hypothetical protein
VIEAMNGRRNDYGALNPTELTPYVTSLGTFNFGGRRLEILVNDGTFEALDGNEKPFLEPGSVIVTAKNCGKGLYGAATLLEPTADGRGEFRTYAGTRIPQHICTFRPPVKETQMISRPLFVPKTTSPWTVARNVFGD